MNFGYFDDERKEYVITRPDTPAPWANYLSFSSQSHFIQTFEHYIGMTPKQYRNSKYKSTW